MACVASFAQKGQSTPQDAVGNTFGRMFGDNLQVGQSAWSVVASNLIVMASNLQAMDSTLEAMASTY